MYRRAVKIAQARIGIVSNNEEIITEPRYFEGQILESLLTDIHSIQAIPYSEDLDAYFIAVDDPMVEPQVRVTEKVLFAAGDFTRYEKECSDNRYSLFGNLGLFFKYLLVTLERYHQVYSFHASSMFSPSRNTLLLVVGGAGAGKTVFLLKGLEDDWQIFSTEMTHFRFTDQGYEFYMGSLFDNIRLGTLIHDFPRANQRLKVEIPNVADIWGYKIAIDMGHIAARPKYLNPRVTVVDAKIESGRDVPVIKTITRKEKIAKLLFDNATEKFGPPVILYDVIPVGSLDTPELMKRRLQTMTRFVEEVTLNPVKSVLAGAKNCMEGI
ncbi:MAG: hypothetical protein EHM36_03440 [Deltaproteobacteria bacterium]|nr:MAG: hypothetical protein EHM36_03440 [Deltaproteobacteria bacterium]